MRILIAILAIICGPAFAQDSWTGPDKVKHLAVGAGISAAVMAATKDERLAFAAGCGAGVAKELYDAQHRDVHTPSGKDLVVTCIGAAIGTKTTSLIFTARGIKYRTVF